MSRAAFVIVASCLVDVLFVKCIPQCRPIILFNLRSFAIGGFFYDLWLMFLSKNSVMTHFQLVLSNLVWLMHFLLNVFPQGILILIQLLPDTTDDTDSIKSVTTSNTSKIVT